MIRQAFSMVRRTRMALRSLFMRNYLRLAYPGVSLAPDVTFARGARVRAFDGGTINIGAGTHIAEFALVEAHGGQVILGENTLVGRGTIVIGRQAITIGTGTLIAEYVSIRDQDHCHTSDAPLAAQGFLTSPIHIGRDVWLAARVTVTRGSRIADHVVIGANAVVRGQLVERGVYAGAPAKRIS